MYPIKRPLVVLLLALTLVLPINVYIIGDAIGAGIQFPLLRYQQTYLGNNVITVLRDLNYVTSGTITGRSALSILLWVSGTLLLVAAIAYFATRQSEDCESSGKPVSLLVGGAGGAYLAACFAQYGFALHGPAGLAIPIGVPLILAIAVYTLKAEDIGVESEAEERDEGDDEKMEEKE
ncbi:MAG TPA: hypothetical protein PLG75_04835 [Methanoculleus sp.]|nr:hypothetical protein [Methanoculleus sp.]